MATCCHLTSDLVIGTGCFTSLNVSVSNETSNVCTDGSILKGPVLGTLSATAYASMDVYYGCPSGGSANINWLKKYDPDTKKMYFILIGGATGSIYGDSSSINCSLTNVAAESPYIQASVSNTPVSLYIKDIQTTGYGFSYTGDPIDFDSEIETGLVFSAGGPFRTIGFSYDLYLSSFSITAAPGQLTTVNYSFSYHVPPKD